MDESSATPEDVNDGWLTAPADTVGIAPERLQTMESAIRSGAFVKITSVALARHGRLVYEAYFDDAGRDGLRNTRSATKTVTSMLVGVAIDQGLLLRRGCPRVAVLPREAANATSRPAQGAYHGRGLPHHEFDPRMR